MDRRTIHRGVAALAIVSILALALAQPAAAAPRAGALDRLADLWSAGETGSLLNRLAVWLEGKPAGKSPRATPATKRGWGQDPNGQVNVEDSVPTDPIPGGSSNS